MNVYLAGALHSALQRQHLEMIAAVIEQDHKVYLPHRDGGLYSQMLRSGVRAAVAAERVQRADCDAIRRSDLVVVVNAGRFITDPGVCFELGYAKALGVRCIAYAPDIDTGGGLNPMIQAGLHAVLGDVGQLTKLPNPESKEA